MPRIFRGGARGVEESSSTPYAPPRSFAAITSFGGKGSTLPQREGALLSPTRQFVERHVLVDADVLRQTEHALGDDVAQDLVGATGDAKTRRRQPAALEETVHRRIFALQDSGFAFELHRERAQILKLRRDDDFRDRRFRSRLLAARERSHGAEGGVAKPGRLHIPVGDALAHGGVLDRRSVLELERARELQQLRHVETTTLPAADRKPLVHECGERHLPALTNMAEAL